jgi:uncharacterized glyoxalase superfamily protein PhnB
VPFKYTLSCLLHFDLLLSVIDKTKDDLGVNILSTLNGTCVILGVFVEDPDKVMANTIAAGAIEISPVQDYDYGYRQGNITDPFGHHWTIEKAI